MLDSAYTKRRCPLWVFDVEKQKWVHWQGKTSPQTQTPTNRKGHSAVVLGSAMLLYGGFVDMKGSSQEFWSLDFDTMAWSLLTGAQGPGPRHSHSATAYQSCMYLFGGLKGLREQRDFWRWNSSSQTWTSLRNKSGPSRLVGHSTVAYKDGMLLFGGGESQNSPKNGLWRYSFSTQTWSQAATLPGSDAPDKIHHCCAGLGPSYQSSTSSPCSSPGLQPSLLDGRLRPFKNKCFPAPLTFLGSDGAIELETFSPDRRYGSQKTQGQSELEGLIGRDAQRIGSCLTFENKAFRTQCADEDLLNGDEDLLNGDEDLLNGDDDDAALHLPDLLLVLGGRPCSRHSPISIWQMTLSDS